MKTRQRRKALDQALATEQKPKTCPGCGAKECISPTGYSNIAPHLGYCVECIGKAMRQAK